MSTAPTRTAPAPADSPRATGPGLRTLLDFTLRLTGARFSARQGESLLYLVSTLAYVVSSALAFTVAGGTWMFLQRWKHPRGVHAEYLAQDDTVGQVLGAYVGLAAIACALLVPALVGLAASAAVLGARGRERRMAALRLLGLSSGDVTRMTLVDTLVQSVLGTAVGALLYLATLPAWSLLTIQAMPVEPTEMLLPLWLAAPVALATVLIGLASAWWGLQRVRVSPLGVARRASSPALRWWRPVAFVALLVAAFLVVTQAARSGSTVMPWIAMGLAVSVVLMGLAVVGPWLLQVVCRALALLPSATVVWAARRVQADPRATWRRVSALGLLAFIGGYVSLMPLATEPPPDAPPAAAFATATAFDITKGVLITLAIGFVLAAAGTYITQASAVFERAEQSRAMHRMGASAAYLRRVAWLEVMAPLVLSLALGAGLGALLASPLAAAAVSKGFEQNGTGPVILGGTLAAGVTLTALALLATAPLQRGVMAELRRRAD